MRFMSLAIASLSLTFAASNSFGACADVPTYDVVKKALVDARTQGNGGLNLDMWGVVVDREGTTCHVVYTGAAVDSQWPGSRMIAAQKANTANAFSLPGMALSTAQLWAGAQPGGFLYNIGLSNPVNQAVAYKGEAASFGSAKDPYVGQKVGGVIVFGGGLALYNSAGKIVGALGVSGDTSCADHNIAWRMRNNLKLDFVPSGASKNKDDNIAFDIGVTGKSKSGFGHPKCVGDEAKIADKLPAVQRPVAAK